MNNFITDEMLGIIIGAVLGFFGAISTSIVNHFLEMRKLKWEMKIQASKELSKKLLEGSNLRLYNAGEEKIYKMIDEGRLPRSYALSDALDSILEELQEDK